MKQIIYFDNAATTPLDKEVLDSMIPHLTENFGNASSIHSIGRKAKSAIEMARKKVATLLNTSPAEIFFTSGGTEADNAILKGAIVSRGIKTVITSKVEHHAVIHPMEVLAKEGKIELIFLPLDAKGNPSLLELEKLLGEKENVLVSLMHGNNEIGNILDLHKVGELCSQHNALFHSDTVQTVAKLPIDLLNTPIDFITGAAHKFYGPKGVGFMYLKAGSGIKPYIEGGAQERNMRGGTENIAGAVGLAKALEIAIAQQTERRNYILDLKKYFIASIEKAIPGIEFNGASGDIENSLYHVVNVRFPAHPDNQMLLFSLDIEGICVSGGSACSSGTDIGSHVLAQLNIPDDCANIRFSFSYKNTKEEIEKVIAALQKILK
jgi:cysteine desulfurase